LSYVGVPRESNNQVSSISNFARNLGGAIGTSFLIAYLARQRQICRLGLVEHLHRGNIFYERFLMGLATGARAQQRQQPARRRASIPHAASAVGRLSSHCTGLYQRVLCAGSHCCVPCSPVVPDEKALGERYGRWTSRALGNFIC
jgi:hypothetical protein